MRWRTGARVSWRAPIAPGLAPWPSCARLAGSSRDLERCECGRVFRVASILRPIGEIEIGIEAPRAGLSRHLDIPIKQCLELVALHGPEAEAREMRRHPFAVAQMTRA